MNGGWIILLFTVGFLYLFFKNRSIKIKTRDYVCDIFSNT